MHIVAYRTPVGRLNVVWLRRRRPLVRAPHDNEHFDALATDAEEKSGLTVFDSTLLQWLSLAKKVG